MAASLFDSAAILFYFVAHGWALLCTVLLSPPTSGVWRLPHQPQLYTCVVVMAAIPQPVQIFSGCKGACVLLPSQEAVVFLLLIQYIYCCMHACSCLSVCS